MDAALDQAVLVFRERGFHAASLADLGTAMKLTPGSIYKAFNDKRAIFLAAFDRYTELRSEQLQRLLDNEKNGLAKLRAVLLFYAESSHEVEGRRGCLVVAAAAELTMFDAGMANHVKAALLRVEDALRKLIGVGQSDGSIPVEIDASAVGCTLMCLLQGFRVVGKAGRSRAEMVAAVEQALRLLA